MDEIKLRQYVIVPKKPKMSPGKIASQVAHATFMALEKQREGIGIERGSLNPKIIRDWKENGMCVIVLQCKNKYDLLGIREYLDQWNIPCHLYIDEGLTEVDPLSPTCLATGVITEDKHWIFSKFKLYK
jgi:peptidyl-tRNA hydrolase